MEARSQVVRCIGFAAAQREVACTFRRTRAWVLRGRVVSAGGEEQFWRQSPQSLQRVDVLRFTPNIPPTLSQTTEGKHEDLPTQPLSVRTPEM
eukprot:2043641-Rhodomonas_salina.2